MEILTQALAFNGLMLLLAAAFIAGLVRGFAGFGTAMIFIPMAALVAEPVYAILMMLTFDFFGPIALLPRAWRDGEPKDVGLLGMGAIIGLPFGAYLLTQLDPVVFRWIVSILAISLLVLLISGLVRKKYRVLDSNISHQGEMEWPKIVERNLEKRLCV